MSAPQAVLRHWFLIYSKPQQERVAVQNLERQGYETYLPMLRRSRRRQGKKFETVEPLFPRYLFVNLSEELDDWGPIRSTRGVSRMIRFGNEAARVPDEFVDEGVEHPRRDREVVAETAMGLDHLATRHPVLAHGERLGEDANPPVFRHHVASPCSQNRVLDRLDRVG